MNQIVLYIIYTVPEHCGHEVIDKVFTDKTKAIEYRHQRNSEWAKNMSYWDGTQTLFSFRIKKSINGIIDFSNEDCDECGMWHCECDPRPPYKTEKAYREYWDSKKQKEKSV